MDKDNDYYQYLSSNNHAYFRAQADRHKHVNNEVTSINKVIMNIIQNNEAISNKQSTAIEFISDKDLTQSSDSDDSDEEEIFNDAISQNQLKECTLANRSKLTTAGKVKILRPLQEENSQSKVEKEKYK